MMSLGARLISDDLVWLSQDDPKSDLTIAHPPSVNTPVQIEARSLGIITPPNTCGATALNVVLDMAVTQTRRLPETEYVEIWGQKLLYLHKVDNPSFPAMLMEYLRSMTGHST